MAHTRARYAAWSWIFSLSLGAAVLVGCSDDLPLKSAGEYCQHDSQCIEGLICLSRQCAEPPSGDPRPLEQHDAGSSDAGMDAGPPETDAGMDAGPPETDAGTDGSAGDAAAADDAAADKDAA